MNRVQSLWSGIVAAALLLVTGCSDPPKPRIKAPETRNPAPNFKLRDSNGQTVQLSDYRGKIVLLNFWATWCGPCKIEVPWFVEFEQRFKDRGFAVLGIAMDDEGWEVVKPFIERRKVNYRVVLGTGTVAELYGGVESLPTTFIIDREGKVAAVHIGLIRKADYQNEIEELLAVGDRAERDGAAEPDFRLAAVR